MKFSCEKYILQNAITVTSRATASKSPIPSLEGLLIEASNEIKITGYDLKKGIYTFIDADIEEQGKLVLNSRLFSEMIRRFPDGIVSVSSDASGMTTIKCGKSEYSLMGIDPNDYPELPSIENEIKISIPQNQLKSMINETIFAVADNDNRPIYTGTLFEIENNILSLVSVDGYRLALRQEKIDGFKENEKISFIVPGIALNDIEKICGEDEDAVISIGEKHISFEIDKTVVVSRRLDGEFLNYKKAIPEKFKYEVVITKDDFMKSVDRVALIINEKTKNPIRLNFNDGKVDIKCTTPLGKAEDVCMFDGNCENLEIGFNDKYLMDALKAAPSKKIKVSLNNGSSPCTITSADDEENKYNYMILPVRLHASE